MNQEMNQQEHKFRQNSRIRQEHLRQLLWKDTQSISEMDEWMTPRQKLDWTMDLIHNFVVEMNNHHSC